MLLKKLKYGPSLKNHWINEILSQLGLNQTHSDKSTEIYETFRDYMTLEQCSRNEAVDFTAKYYRLSKPQMNQILRRFNQE